MNHTTSMPEKPIEDGDLLPEVRRSGDASSTAEQQAGQNREQRAMQKVMEVFVRTHPTENRPQSQQLENLIERHGAIPFAAKFEKQKRKEGFKIGEKVGAAFIITDAYKDDRTIDKAKVALLVDGIDVRASDQFNIHVSPEEYQALQQCKGFTFNGIIEITGEGKYLVSNMFVYEAKPITLESNLPVNPESIEKMEQGSIVIVEGKIVDFRVTKWSEVLRTIGGEKEPYPQEAIITVESQTGDLVTVNIDPSVKYEQSSSLENVRGKAPEIGDVVRINATVIDTEPKKSKALPKPEKFEDGGRLPKPEDGAFSRKALFAPWCRTTYLLQPNPERQKSYDQLRASVAERFAELEAVLSPSSYDEARNVISRIIKEEVTEAERKRLTELVLRMPDAERPLMIWDRYEADEINKTFSIDVDSMTRQQFYAFAKKVAATPFAESPEINDGSHDYIYRVMDDIDISVQEQEEIMALAIESRTKYFQDLDRSGEGYDHKRDWSDKYMLDQSLGYLTHLSTASSVKKLIDLCHKILTSEEGLGGTKGEMTYGAADALRRAYWYAREKPEVLKVLEDNLEKIRQMERKLVEEQLNNPETTDSRVLTLVRTGETNPHLAFKFLSAPKVHHKNSGKLESLREVIGKLDPFLRELQEGDFHAHMVTRMETLSERSAFFSRALEAIRQKGYTFVLYGRNDGSIPVSIHRLMHGGNGAVTVKEKKTVYIDLDALRSFAFTQQRGIEDQLHEALVDESVHIMSDLTYTPLSPAETERELVTMKETPDTLPSERSLHDIIKEEILAHVVSEIVRQQLGNPEYTLDAHALDFPDGGFVKSKLPGIKTQLGVEVLIRMYSVDIRTLPDSEQRILLQRLVDFLNSGEIEKHLYSELRNLGLIQQA